jgi:hypothetical protein
MSAIPAIRRMLMWIFTRDGFVSAVYKYDAIQVRARDRESLTSLAKSCGAGIRHSPTADYPYRVSITRENFADWLHRQAMELDYSNFKDEVLNVRGLTFAKPLHAVWDEMHRVEDDGARSNS